MNKKESTAENEGTSMPVLMSGLAEVMEGQLEQLVNCLYQQGCEKSRLYEEIIALTEKGLFKIALKRSNNVKTSAATFLGINRNTFQNKLRRLGLEDDKY